MSNLPELRAATRHPVTVAIDPFGTLPVEQRAIALAAVLIEAGAITELQLRTAVFRMSGDPLAIERIHATNL
jgi:hypothetical protein